MTKTEILEAAARVFARNGFHAASMADIADEVQLKKASLYHHVESKQKILFDILETAIQRAIDEVEKVIESELPPDVKLRRAMAEYFRLLAEYKEQAAVLLLDYRSLSPEYRSTHIKKRDAFEKIWRDIILEGHEKGVFECEHPGLAAKDILGMMNWSVMWFDPEGTLTAREIAEHCADAYLNGLRKR